MSDSEQKNKIKTTIMLEPDQHDWIKTQSNIKQVSQGKVIRDLIREKRNNGVLLSEQNPGVGTSEKSQ